MDNSAAAINRDHALCRCLHPMLPEAEIPKPRYGVNIDIINTELQSLRNGNLIQAGILFKNENSFNIYAGNVMTFDRNYQQKADEATAFVRLQNYNGPERITAPTFDQATLVNNLNSSDDCFTLRDFWAYRQFPEDNSFYQAITEASPTFNQADWDINSLTTQFGQALRSHNPPYRSIDEINPNTDPATSMLMAKIKFLNRNPLVKNLFAARSSEHVSAESLRTQQQAFYSSLRETFVVPSSTCYATGSLAGACQNLISDDQMRKYRMSMAKTFATRDVQIAVNEASVAEFNSHQSRLLDDVNRLPANGTFERWHPEGNPDILGLRQRFFDSNINNLAGFRSRQLGDEVRLSRPLFQPNLADQTALMSYTPASCLTVSGRAKSSGDPMFELEQESAADFTTDVTNNYQYQNLHQAICTDPHLRSGQTEGGLTFSQFRSQNCPASSVSRVACTARFLREYPDVKDYALAYRGTFASISSVLGSFGNNDHSRNDVQTTQRVSSNLDQLRADIRSGKYYDQEEPGSVASFRQPEDVAQLPGPVSGAQVSNTAQSSTSPQKQADNSVAAAPMIYPSSVTAPVLPAVTLPPAVEKQPEVQAAKRDLDDLNAEKRSVENSIRDARNANDDARLAALQQRLQGLENRNTELESSYRRVVEDSLRRNGTPPAQAQAIAQSGSVPFVSSGAAPVFNGQTNSVQPTTNLAPMPIFDNSGRAPASLGSGSASVSAAASGASSLRSDGINRALLDTRSAGFTQAINASTPNGAIIVTNPRSEESFGASINSATSGGLVTVTPDGFEIIQRGGSTQLSGQDAQAIRQALGSNSAVRLTVKSGNRSIECVLREVSGRFVVVPIERRATRSSLVQELNSSR